MGPRKRLGSVAARNVEAGEQRGIGQGVDEDAQRHLVESITEQADRLGQPEAGKSGVQCEPDIGVLANLGAERLRCGEWLRDAGAETAAEDDRPLKADVGACGVGGPCSDGPSRTQADPAQRILLAAEKRAEHEPAQAGPDEDVTQAGDVRQDGDGQRDDVRDRPGAEEELESEHLRQQDVERGVELFWPKTGRGEAAVPRRACSRR